MVHIASAGVLRAIRQSPLHVAAAIGYQAQWPRPVTPTGRRHSVTRRAASGILFVGRIA
jgi:hypothetical protein